MFRDTWRLDPQYSVTLTPWQDLTPLHERWVYDKLCAAVDNDNRRRCKQLGKEIAADVARAKRLPGDTIKNVQSLDPSKTAFLRRYVKRLGKQIERENESNGRTTGTGI